MAKRGEKNKSDGSTKLAWAQAILNAHQYDGNGEWDKRWLHLNSADIIHIARSLEWGDSPASRVETVEQAAEVFNRFALHGVDDWEAIKTPAVNVVQSESKHTMYYRDMAVIIARGLLCGPVAAQEPSDTKGGE